MIFFLEIEGALKQCSVKEPYCSLLQQWNAIKHLQKVGSEGFEFAKDALRSVARECVQAGAYEVRI
jgi:hypothetical protein